MVRSRVYVSSTIALLCLMLFSPAAALFAQDATPSDATPSDVTVDAAAADAKNELLVFEVNRNVTKADRGFPRNDPPRREANGNWRTPVNYAEGTFYYRVEIRHQPKPQNMRLQFCAWQDNFRGESCGTQKNVVGRPGTVVTWSQSVGSMWKKGGRGVDWSRPRQRYGLAIKDSRGKPVSDYNGWRWNGHNPNDWYPLDIRFTVVVVAKGAQFSGWQNYGGSANDNALITDESAAALDAEGMPINSQDGNDLNFGSGMDEAQWETESATDAVDIEDQAMDNKFYLPLVTG